GVASAGDRSVACWKSEVPWHDGTPTLAPAERSGRRSVRRVRREAAGDDAYPDRAQPGLAARGPAGARRFHEGGPGGSRPEGPGRGETPSGDRRLAGCHGSWDGGGEDAPCHHDPLRL